MLLGVVVNRTVSVDGPTFHRVELMARVFGKSKRQVVNEALNLFWETCGTAEIEERAGAPLPPGLPKAAAASGRGKLLHWASRS